MSASEPTPADAKKSVLLLVDDDPSLLETTAALLEDDFDVLKASSAEAALKLLESHPVAVICTDFQMGGMNGLELLRRVYGSAPRRCGVLVTGLKEQLPRGVAGDEAVFAVVYKPYAIEALLTTLRDAFRVTTMAFAANKFSARARKLKGGNG
jgi:two-component system response regulator HupR/HoxA